MLSMSKIWNSECGISHSIWKRLWSKCRLMLILNSFTEVWLTYNDPYIFMLCSLIRSYTHPLPQLREWTNRALSKVSMWHFVISLPHPSPDLPPRQLVFSLYITVNWLQSMGSLGVGYDWVTSLSLFTFVHWRRQWQPTPVFLPGESQGRGSLVGCCPWGCTELDTTDVT